MTRRTQALIAALRSQPEHLGRKNTHLRKLWAKRLWSNRHWWKRRINNVLWGE